LEVLFILLISLATKRVAASSNCLILPNMFIFNGQTNHIDFIVLILVIAIKWISQSRKTTLGMGGGQYRQLLTAPLPNRPQIVPGSLRARGLLGA
jgi:hypothetical protein